MACKMTMHCEIPSYLSRALSYEPASRRYISWSSHPRIPKKVVLNMADGTYLRLVFPSCTAIITLCRPREGAGPWQRDVGNVKLTPFLHVFPHLHERRDRHVAVTVQDLEPLIASLEQHDRHFTFSKSGRRAVFTRDLDANAIEFIEDSSTQ